MRGTLRAVGLFVALVALGCAKDRYGMNPKFPETYVEPPNEKRFNEPDTAPYKKPPPPKKEDSMMNKTNMGGPGNAGGF